MSPHFPASQGSASQGSKGKPFGRLLCPGPIDDEEDIGH